MPQAPDGCLVSVLVEGSPTGLVISMSSWVVTVMAARSGGGVALLLDGWDTVASRTGTAVTSSGSGRLTVSTASNSHGRTVFSWPSVWKIKDLELSRRSIYIMYHYQLVVSFLGGILPNRIGNLGPPLLSGRNEPSKLIYIYIYVIYTVPVYCIDCYTT